LVDALENQVLNPIFLREEFTIAISLNTEGEGGEKYVKGSIAMSYFVKNISTKDQDHVIRCNLDEVLGEGSACLESVTLDNQPLNLSKLPIGTKVHRDSNVLKFEHPIRIRQGSGVRVQIVGYQRMAQADLWPWHMLTPSDSMTVTVNNSTDLEVLLTLLHPAADEADNQVSHSLWNAQVTINNIVLPYQGFEVRWWPRPPVTAKALAQNASPSRPVENKLKEGGSLAGVEKPATPANSETAPPGRVD
jgi:hypothetical protein